MNTSVNTGVNTKTLIKEKFKVGMTKYQLFQAARHEHGSALTVGHLSLIFSKYFNNSSTNYVDAERFIYEQEEKECRNLEFVNKRAFWVAMDTFQGLTMNDIIVYNLNR